MGVIFTKYWPLVSVVLLFWCMVTLLVFLSMQQNDGKLIYPLDDTYIHMSIAQNAAIHQVWGVTKYAFSSTTSSPLWTFILTLMYMVFGVNDWAPLLLNVITGTVLIVFAGLFLEKFIKPENPPGSGRLTIMTVLLAAFLITPLSSLAMISIEHVLHILLTLCFFRVAISVLDAPAADYQFKLRIWNSGSADRPASSPNVLLYLVLLAPALTMSRYEGLFLAFVVCVIMLTQKKWSGAVVAGSAALLPVIGYGLWSLSKGWYFLPNPLLLKGQMPDHSLPELVAMLHRTLFEIQTNPVIMLMLIASLVLALIYRLKPGGSRMWYAHLIFSGTLLLHMTFASTGWLYRYEAYLVFVGICIIGASSAQLIPGLVSRYIANPAVQNSTYPSGNHKTDVHLRLFDRILATAAVLLLAGVIAYPFVHRAAYSLALTPKASGNIYEQHYQMGRFLGTYYQGDAVAVNDIGAVTWLSDIRLLDLWGLGSLEPATLRREGRYTTDEMARMAKEKDVVIAIVYDDWFDGKDMSALPAEWERVGQWRISGNVIAGSDVVSFYAVNPVVKSDLIQNLNRFSGMLPGGVEHSGLLPSQ